MDQLNLEDIKALYKFKDFLDEIDYGFVLNRILGDEVFYVYPLPDFTYARTEIKKISNSLGDIIEFFLLGIPKRIELIEEFISNDIIECLLKLDILSRDEQDYWLQNLLLISHSNCYFFVSNVNYYPTCTKKEQTPYIGPDTFLLSKMIINSCSGTILDVCTGNGIQAVLAALTSEKVYAFDSDYYSVKIATINTYINKVNQKVKVLQSDINVTLANYNIEFDFIIVNPQVISQSKKLRYQLCYNIGQENNSVVDKIMSDLMPYLKDKGTFIMSGQSLGKDNILKIEETLIDKKYKLYVYGFIPINSFIENNLESSNTLDDNKSFKDVLSWKNEVRHNYDGLYVFTIKVNGTYVNQEKNVIESWVNENDIFSTNILRIDKENSYIIIGHNNETFVTDEDIKSIILQLNGELTYKEVLNSIPFNIRMKNASRGNSFFNIKCAKIFNALSRKGIIFKEGKDAKQTKFR